MRTSQASRELELIQAQIDFANEHYYNLYPEAQAGLEQTDLQEESWANLSSLTADLAKIRGELFRLGRGVEQLRMPAVEAIGLDKVAEQLRGLEFRLRPLGEILSRPEEESQARKLLKDLLPVADSLDRVFELVANQPGSVPEGVERGLKAVYQMLVDTFARYQLRQVEVGTEFNPHLQQAMGTEPNPGLSDGMVSRVLLKGYTLKDEVLRSAQVVVVQNKGQAGD